MDELADDEGPDLDARQLCPDGACTGVLDDDGRCKVCGAGAKPLAAEAPYRPEHVDPEEFADRSLCPDGACIGLVGDDGRCKVCGREGQAPS